LTVQWSRRYSGALEAVSKHPPQLSKTRFQGGLQCLKRVWLEHHRRDLASPPDAATQARFSTGHRVGQLARSRWPGGVLVTESAARHEAAAARTRALLADPGVPAIYEAAFTFGRVRIRADILVRRENGFELVEVKSSSRLKDEHHTDVAVQLWVLRGCGVDVRRAGLLHLNREYVWPGGPYDVDRLFSLADVTESAFELQAQIGENVATMLEVLAGDTAPSIAIGRHCDRPHECPFKAHCWAAAPADSVSQLPRAGHELLECLAAHGIERIAEIPDGLCKLTPLQERVRACVAAQTQYVDVEALREACEEIEHPICFLDFETFGPALPIYAGTRPYETIPFQWSAHLVDETGHVEHREFLWTDPGDPRPAFIRSLREVLPDGGSIVVYSGYEESRLEALASAFPEEGEPLLETFVEQRVDLLEIIRRTVYHPDFHGSFSLKNVLPVLVPGMGYEGLAIGDGMEAAAAYEEMIARGTRPQRRCEIEVALRTYCCRDTEAELRLFERLRRM
jgi:predicted RecB family nuclease